MKLIEWILGPDRGVSIETNQSKQNKMFALFLFIISIFLYTFHLDAWVLWQDEANYALLSMSCIHNGYASAFYNSNVIWPDLYDVTPKGYYWILWGWFPMYINGALLSLLGKTTFVARLGSALIIIIYLQWQFWFLKRQKISKYTAEWTTLLMLFSVPVILYTRQCSYYAPMIAFSGFLFLQVLYRERLNHSLIFLGSIALLNTHLLTWGISMIAIFFGQILLKKNYKETFIFTIYSTLMSLPFLYLYQVWRLFNRSGAGDHAVTFMPLKNRFEYYLNSIDITLIPFWLIGLLLIIVALRYKKVSIQDKYHVHFMLLTIGIGFTLVPILTGFVYLRYVLSFLVLVLFLIGYLFSLIVQLWPKYVSLTFILITLPFTIGGFRSGPQGNFSQLTYFFNEIRHQSLTDVNSAITSFILSKSKAGEVVVTNYGDFPLQFYTELSIRGGPRAIGLHSSRSYENMGINLLTDPPKWIIYRRYWQQLHKKKILSYLEKAKYQKWVLPVQDSAWGNRPSPYHHRYFEEPVVNPVIIYERVDESSLDSSEKIS